MKRMGKSPAMIVLIVVGFCAPLLHAQDDVLPTSLSPVPTHSTTPTQRVDGQTSRGSCTVDTDCDDRDGCTENICDTGVCTFPPIADCIGCEVTYDCPAIDLVFLMDTSGSMRDEGAVLCSTIDQIVADLAADNIAVDVSILGMTETPGDVFSCLTDSVSSLFCDTVPCNVTSCPFPGNPSSYESWGPATAVVADRFAWTPGSTRLIIPMSDEGPCNGDEPDGCNDPGDDRNSITDAIASANLNNVTVSPITGTNAGGCAKFLAEVLAAGTGGTAYHMQDPVVEFADALFDAIVGTCNADAACNDHNPCTSNDTCTEKACTGQPIPDCSQCINAGDCDDGNACTDDVCINSVCVSTLNYDDTADCCDPLSGALAAVSDGNECTDDVCDPASGIVTHTNLPGGSSCDDGVFCNGADTCFSGACTMHAGNPCIAGAECADACDEAGRSCNSPSGTPCTSDGNVCTDNVCDGAGACIAVNNTASCDDGFFCTVGEKCTNGVCAGGTPRDCSFMDTDCGVGVCVGELERCNTKPLADGTTCDDGDDCTTDDVCDGFGRCVGTPTDTPECRLQPELCIEAQNECLRPGEEFKVNVVLKPSVQVIVGGGFSIEFDPTAFQVLEVDPGGIVDPLSPFRIETLQLVDNTRGTVIYGVGIGAGDNGTTGPAIMASLRVRTLASCAVVEPFCFLQGSPVGTTLTNDAGEQVPFIPCCGSGFSIGGDPVVMTCPGDVITNADAGGVTALVTWDPPSYSGGCPGGVQNLVCTGTNSNGASVGNLVQQGGILPSGLSAFQCDVVDSCGAASSCSWVVQVNRSNRVDVHLQLSPVMHGDSGLFRCIEFELYSSCVEAPVIVSEVIQFGGPFNLPGHADHVLFKVPAGNYVCMTARDPLHTLRSSDLLEIVDGRYEASFQGDPFFGGNWLINGNLNGDRVIDILDFGALVYGQFHRTLDPNTTCGTEAPHADFDGNGIVDELDFSFISINFLSEDKSACCDTGGVASTGDGPVMDISVSELRDRGLGYLAIADLNHDGRLNAEDVGQLMYRSASKRSSLQYLRPKHRSESR